LQRFPLNGVPLGVDQVNEETLPRRSVKREGVRDPCEIVAGGG
jgi:hypothetical protein